MSTNKRGGGQDHGREGGERLAHQDHRLSLATNAALAAMKLSAGTLLVSPALVADGWHSMADTISSAVAWSGFRLGREPADDDHHDGHGNLEALAGLLVGLVLVVGGALVLWCSLRALTLDNFGDALSSVIVLLAILLRGFGYPGVELFVAGAIGVVIAAMGIGSVRSGFDVLMVRVTDQTLRGCIAETARCVDGVRAVQNVRIHPLGSDVRVDLEVNVDGELTVATGHDIAHEVERQFTIHPPEVRDVHVHVNPCLLAHEGSPLLPGFAPEDPRT